jgi:peptidase E
MPAHIIAIGGGGFLHGTELGLDRYVLEQSPVAKPRIGFIATASGDAASTFLKFYTRFAPLNCRPSHLSFFDRTPDLEKWVHSQDIIYVSGGNTKSMLAVWREWNLPNLLQSAIQKGTVLAGISAGAICWFESGLTDSMQGDLMPLPCLGFLSGSCCPHYSGEPQRKPMLRVISVKEQCQLA